MCDSTDYLIEQLNLILRQIYSPQCQQDVKQNLYAELSRFQQSDVCLPVCVKLMESCDEIMLMFALHAIQDCISHKWHKLSSELREESFNRLLNVLLTRHGSIAKFVASKLAQQISQMARLDVLELDDTPRSNTLVSAVTQCLLDSKLEWVGLLLLHNMLDEYFHPETAPVLSCKQSSIVVQKAVEISKHFIAQITDSILKFEQCTDVRILSYSLAVVSLICEHQAQLVLKNEPLLQAIYNGCFKAEIREMCLPCLQSLTDIVSQPIQIPPSILIAVFNVCTNLFRTIKPTTGDDYKHKLLSLCHVLIHKGAPRLADTQYLSLLLVSLTNYMATLPAPELYSECLRCWHVVCDRLLTLSNESLLTACQALTQPLTGLLKLTHSTLLPHNLSDWSNWEPFYELPQSAIQVETAQLELNAFTDMEDVPDFDSFDALIRSILELTAKVAMLSPDQVYVMYNDTFHQCMDSVIPAQHHLLTPLDLVRTQNSMRAVSRLSFILNIESHFHERALRAKNIVQKLCQFLERFSQDISMGNQDVMNLLSMGLLCFRGHCHWLNECYCRAQRSGEDIECVSAFITSAFDTSTHIIVHLVSSKQQSNSCLFQAAESCLYSILLTVRPHAFILHGKSLKRLIELVCTEHQSLCHLLTCSLAAYLMLPWFNATDEELDWSRRKSLFNQIIIAISTKFIQTGQLDIQKNSGFLKLSSKQLLHFLREFLKTVNSESCKCKKLVGQSIWPIAETTLHCIKHATDEGLREILLDLLGCCMQTLSVQFGSDFASCSLQVLGHIAMNNSDVQVLSCHALLTVLDILDTLAKEMSKQFFHLVPELVNIILHTLRHPCTKLSSITTDVRDKYYAVVHSLISSRWRFFFPNISKDVSKENDSNVWTGVPTENDETPSKILQEQRTKLIVELLEILVESFQDQSDCTLIKSNIERLSDLHKRCCLLDKAVFQSHLSIPLLDSLWNILIISSNHSLIQEDIAEIICLITNSCSKSCLDFVEQYFHSLLNKVMDKHTAKDIFWQYSNQLNSNITPFVVVNISKDIRSATNLR